MCPKKDNLHRKLILQSLFLKNEFRTFAYDKKQESRMTELGI